VHAREHGAHRLAVRHAGGQLTLPPQFVHHGGGLALHRVQDLATGGGGRVGHRDASTGQVLHEVQIERQLLETQPLEHGEHMLQRGAIALAGHEIVGVFNAALDASEFGEVPQVQGVQQGCGFRKRDFGVNGHETDGQKFRMRQLLRPALPVRLPPTSPVAEPLESGLIW